MSCLQVLPAQCFAWIGCHSYNFLLFLFLFQNLSSFEKIRSITTQNFSASKQTRIGKKKFAGDSLWTDQYLLLCLLFTVYYFGDRDEFYLSWGFQ